MMDSRDNYPHSDNSRLFNCAWLGSPEEDNNIIVRRYYFPDELKGFELYLETKNELELEVPTAILFDRPAARGVGVRRQICKKSPLFAHKVD